MFKVGDHVRVIAPKSENKGQRGVVKVIYDEKRPFPFSVALDNGMNVPYAAHELEAV